MGNAVRNGGEYYTPLPLIRGHRQSNTAQYRPANLRRRRCLGWLPVRIFEYLKSKPNLYHQGVQESSGADLLRKGKEVPRLRP
jgi:hypothetical protein